MGRAVERKLAERTLRMAVGGVRKEEIRASYELGHFPRSGVAVELFRFAHLGNLSAPHNGNPIGEAERLFLIVSYKDHSRSGSGEDLTCPRRGCARAGPRPDLKTVRP